MDRFSDYDSLARACRPGRDYVIRTHRGETGVAIVVLHGGGIEPGTFEVGEFTAASDHALYVFEGIRKRGNQELHVTSTRFNEPRLLDLLAGANEVMTLHGCSDAGRVVHLGGLDESLAARIQAALEAIGLPVERSVRLELAGTDPLNPCNRGRTGRGVQLEISEGLRREMFLDWATRAGRRLRRPPFDRFVGALRRALEPPPGVSAPA